MSHLCIFTPCHADSVPMSWLALRQILLREYSYGDRHCTDSQEVLNQITFEADLQAAVLDADYLQECGPELLDVKRALFAELDQLCSLNTILASSTSGFMTSEFAEHLKGRSRVLVAHPVNPPHLEIIEGLSLEIATPDDARAILQLKGREQVAF